MPTPALLASGFVDATGFTTASVDPGAGVVLEMDVYCASGHPDDVQTVTGLGLTWTRLDNPSSFAFQSFVRWVAVIPRGSTPPTPGAVTFGGIVSSGLIEYQLKAWTGFLGSVIDQAYRNFDEPFSGFLYCLKTEFEFDLSGFPGPALMPEDRGSYAAAGLFSDSPVENPTGYTAISRVQDGNTVLVTGIGLEDALTVSAAWSGATPFIRRALYSELRSEMFAEDLFETPAVGDPLFGTNGGVGWARVPGTTNQRSWFVQDEWPTVEIAAGNLVVSGLAGSTTGNKLAMGGTYRSLGRALFHRRETLPVAYFSAVVARNNDTAIILFVSQSAFETSPDGASIRFGCEGSNFARVWQDGGSSDATSFVVPQDETPVFLVLKVEWVGSAFTASLFVNPVPGDPEPGTPDAQITGTHPGVRCFSAYASDYTAQVLFLDSVRFGEEWWQVTPASGGGSLTNASPTPASVEPSVLVCTNASPAATAVSASSIAVTSGAPLATQVEASVLGLSTTSPVPAEPGASRLAVTSSSPTATAVGGSRLAVTNASPAPAPVGESSLENTLTNTSPTPVPVAPSRLTVTSLAPVALAVAASVLASVAGPPVPSPVAPSRLALVARPPVALGVGPSRLALAASPPLPAPVGPSSLALTSRSPVGVSVGPSSVLDSLTNASPVPLPVGASCVAVVARAPVPVGVLASVLTVTSRSPVAVAVGASNLGADATHTLAPRVRRVIPGSGTTYVHRPSEVLDYSVDWSRRLAPDDTIVASTWVLSGTLSSPRPASHDDHVATVWLATPTAGVEARATNRITTAAGRTFEATLRLFSADPPVGGVGTTGETPVHRVAPGARRASTGGTSEFEQDPNERVEYSFDWVLRLRSDEGEDDQIATSVWFIGGLDASIHASTHDTRCSTVWPVVGRLGARSRVTNRITTVAGRVFEASFVVRVVDK